MRLANHIMPYKTLYAGTARGIRAGAYYISLCHGYNVHAIDCKIPERRRRNAFIARALHFYSSAFAYTRCSSVSAHISSAQSKVPVGALRPLRVVLGLVGRRSAHHLTGDKRNIRPRVVSNGTYVQISVFFRPRAACIVGTRRKGSYTYQ